MMETEVILFLHRSITADFPNCNNSHNDDDDDDDNNNPPSITVNGTTMSATTRTAHLQREIPIEEGFTLDDFLATASLLGCNPMQLCIGLVDTPGNGGISPELLAELLLVVYGRTVTATVSATGIEIEVREMTAEDEEIITIKVTPQLAAVRQEDGSTEVCVICMESAASSQEEEWSSAAGCDTHRFHTACIRLWPGGTCPTCRAPFRV